jgi:tripartite ATP-independent transporter DctM subunit
MNTMDISLIVLSSGFLFLIILGCPIAFAMILAFMAYCVAEGVTLTLLPLKLVGALESFPLLAVPFFLLAAKIMNAVGVTDRLFNFVEAVLGHVRGGLGHANVMASIIFAGISGSAAADAAGLGTIEIKAMTDRGYPRDFSAAITVASSVIGPIIPPSISMIIYSVMAGERITDLFAGGIIPGLIMGLSLMVYISLVAKRLNLPRGKKPSWGVLFRSFLSAFLPLLAPFIIVGSILTGVVTPTEGGVVAVVYSLCLGVLYRSIRLRDIYRCLEESITTTAVCLFMLAASGAYGWAITIKKIPELVLSLLGSLTQSPTVALFLIALVLIFLGCIMSADAALIITVPILISLAEGYHIDLVYMGVLAVVTLCIGVITPPVGVCLFVITEVAQIPFERVVRATLPFVVPEIATVILLILFPSLVLLIPNLIR